MNPNKERAIKDLSELIDDILERWTKVVRPIGPNRTYHEIEKRDLRAKALDLIYNIADPIP